MFARRAWWPLLIALPALAQSYDYPPPSRATREPSSPASSVLRHAFSPPGMPVYGSHPAYYPRAAAPPTTAGPMAAPIAPRAVHRVAIFEAPAEAHRPTPTVRGGFGGSPAYAEAVALLETRQGEKAHTLLAALEPAHSGERDYDYLLGVAALETGRANEAVFSLQRAATGDKTFAGARLELARAQFAVGDNEEARREFLALQKLKPPEEAAEVIRRYLSAIEERAQAYEPRLQAAVTAEAGFDSNANSGTRISQFSGLVLDEQSRETASAYLGVGAGAAYSRPITPRLRWRSTLRLGHRQYPEARFVSSTGAALSSELAWRADRFSLSAGPVLGVQLVDGDLNQTVYALNLRGRTGLAGGDALSLGLRGGLVRYGDGFADARVQQLLGDMAYQWRPGEDWQVDIGPIAGRERSDDLASLSRRLYGLQTSAYGPLWGYPVRTELGLLKSRYDDDGVLETRDDTQTSLRLGMDLQGVLPGWLLSPQLELVNNQSNLGLYDYLRVAAGLSLTREVP